MNYSRTFGFIAALALAAPAWTAGRMPDLQSAQNPQTAAIDFASGVTSLEVGQNKVVAAVEFPGGIQADLVLRFEQALGLNAQSLGLSARLIDPTSVTARLPATSSVPTAFPLMIAIEPPASGPLAFSGTVSIDLHTHNLTYAPNSPLRLMAAEGGGNFQDITSSNALGSYRTGGAKGGFSEFLIVADLRPVNTVITEKFQRIQAELDDNANAIAGSVLTSLQSTLGAARKLSLANDPIGAAGKIDEFSEQVAANSGAAIPDVWRSARDVVNVAGDLRGLAATLKFSLLFKASGGS